MVERVIRYPERTHSGSLTPRCGVGTKTTQFSHSWDLGVAPARVSAARPGPQRAAQQDVTDRTTGVIEPDIVRRRNKRERSGMKNFRDRKWAAYRRSWAQVSKLLQTLARSCLVREVRSTAYAYICFRKPEGQRLDLNQLIFATTAATLQDPLGLGQWMTLIPVRRSLDAKIPKPQH